MAIYITLHLLLFLSQSVITLAKISRSAEVQVVLTDDATESDLNEILRRHTDFTYKSRLSLRNTPTKYLLLVDQSSSNSNRLADDDPSVRNLRTESKVSSVTILERKKFRTLQAAKASKKGIVSDSEVETLWYMSANGKANHNIQEAWSDGFSGKGVTIAVIDSKIEINHSDLMNINKSASYDYNDDDADPTPDDEGELTDRHGTAVAGIIGATRGNNICTVGVAFNADIVGLIGGEITDFQINQAMAHEADTVDIYCNSWGITTTSDFTMSDQSSLLSNIEVGRGGKGSIYVFASGNDGIEGNSNAWSMTSSIYTISIGAIDNFAPAHYTSYGTNIMASAYGGGVENRLMKSTVPFDSCSNEEFAGTSFSVPLATGIIGLALEANGDLTWRDVQHLVVRAAQPYKFPDPRDGTKWIKNGRGLSYHPKIGFGILDAKRMVDLAQNWPSVTKMLQFTSRSATPKVNSTRALWESDTLLVYKSDCLVRVLENVVVTVDVSYSAMRGTIELELVSPSRTSIKFNNARETDALMNALGGTFTWSFKIVAFWGENATGKWKLNYRSINQNVEVRVNDWHIDLYGTLEFPRPTKRVKGRITG